MRVLVTGGAGFIGSHIVDALVEARHDVTIVDSLWAKGGGRREWLHPAAAFHQLDVTTPAFAALVGAERPDVIVHQAAQHSVKISTDDPAYDAQVNVLGLINLLTAAARAGTRKVVFASSGATYGTPVTLPMDEQSPQQPESPYGISKMVSEHYLRYWRDAYGLHFTALRYGNVYGPRQDPTGEAGVIAIFARRMLQRQPVRLDWDGEQTKDYVYVGDVARANLLALTAGDDDVFCIASGRPTSVNEIYRRLVELTGVEAPIQRAPMRPGDIYRAYFDVSKARHVLGWEPETTFEEGMRRTVESLR